MSIDVVEGISLIEQHGEEHAEGLISIVETFEDSAAGTAGGAPQGRDEERTCENCGHQVNVRGSWVHNVHSLYQFMHVYTFCTVFRHVYTILVVLASLIATGRNT